jgi:hypothetical protein
VRLTRKFADLIDGVDLSSVDVGDRIDLSRHDAEVLIAEGWAERAAHRVRRRPGEARSAADDKSPQQKPSPEQKKR